MEQIIEAKLEVVAARSWRGPSQPQKLAKPNGMRVPEDYGGRPGRTPDAGKTTLTSFDFADPNSITTMNRRLWPASFLLANQHRWSSITDCYSTRWLFDYHRR